MKKKQVIRFILDSIAIGLIAGFLLWLFLPGIDREVKPIGAPRSEREAASVVSYSQAVESAAPAIVNIYTSRSTLQERDPASLGSGVIIDDKGHILTNDHVIKDADEIAVALQDGRSAVAKVIGRDPESDLAVLSIELKRLPVIRWGDSDLLKVGDVVLAIGNSFGVGQTVTLGIISGTGRNQLGLSTFENFIQTDAAINPGNSGGALVNALGDLIGINTAIFSRSGGSEGIGFAIPANLARGLLKQIIENGKVARGWLGVVIQELTPQLAESFHLKKGTGVIVSGVIVPGPAADAGLKVGDIMVSIDGVHVDNSRAALNKIASYRPGAQIKIELIRLGEKLSVHAKVSERPQFN